MCTLLGGIAAAVKNELSKEGSFARLKGERDFTIDGINLLCELQFSSANDISTEYNEIDRAKLNKYSNTNSYHKLKLSSLSKNLKIC